jgi:hypothetical protein
MMGLFRLHESCLISFLVVEGLAISLPSRKPISRCKLNEKNHRNSQYAIAKGEHPRWPSHFVAGTIFAVSLGQKGPWYTKPM